MFIFVFIFLFVSNSVFSFNITQNIFSFWKTKYYNYHEWIDYWIRYKKLYSPFDGKVLIAAYRHWYWNTIVLKNDEKKYYLLISHLKNLKVKKGTIIKKWTYLWTSWMTWNSTGPHIHLEFYKDWIIQDKFWSWIIIKKLINKENKEDLNNSLFIDYSFWDIYMKYNWEKIKKDNLRKYDEFFSWIRNISKEFNIPERYLIQNSINSNITIKEVKNNILLGHFWNITGFSWKTKKYSKDHSNFINCYYGKEFRWYKYNCNKYKNFWNNFVSYIENINYK